MSVLDDEIKEKLSCPLLIFPGLNYNVGEGIFIIGKDPKEWGHNDIGSDFLSFENPPVGIDKEKTLMEAQADWFLWNYEEECGKGNTFFNAVKKITGINQGKNFFESPFVWDDLIAVSYNGGSYMNPEVSEIDKKRIVEYSEKKLRMELSIAKPKIAIFLIGTYAGYGGCFWNMFPEIREKDLKHVEGFSDLNHFVLTLEGHSIECYATSHPCSKKWNDGKNEVLKKLAEIVSEAPK